MVTLEFNLFLCAIVILSCILANKFSYKFGVPSLVLFMIIGMIFGADGIFKINYDNYDITEKVCSIALIFIMFYSGFCTKWKVAKSVAKESILLSTLGVFGTAFLVFLFCHYVLSFSYIESFLIGAVLSPTDAASVFSILRSKKLNLKDNTASILELESGSNDPIAYMLVIIGLSFLNNDSNISILPLIFKQIFFGILIGIVIAIMSIYVMKRVKRINDELDSIFVIAIALMSFALSVMIDGNGYLSVYITGILLGNSSIGNKINLVHFFDGITGLSQILIFFLLGLLANPHEIPGIFLIGVFICIFLTLIARPAVVFVILKIFKCSNDKCMLVSWSGLRGASSIVFSIMIIASNTSIQNNIYHIVLLVAFMSVLIQGSLLSLVASKLNMVDEKFDIRKTFNDYQEESDMTLMRVFIPNGHHWQNKTLQEIQLPKDSLALMIKRNDETIMPKGDTEILAGDSVILSIPKYYDEDEIKLKEIVIDKNHKWCNKCISNLSLSDDILIAMIKRGDENIIPRGRSKIKENDIVVIYNSNKKVAS